MSSSEKLDELLSLKDDAKHPDLSNLLKCSAEFQSKLAEESERQSNIHLIVSIVALIVAAISLVVSIGKGVGKEVCPKPSEIPSKTDKAPKTSQRASPEFGQGSLVNPSFMKKIVANDSSRLN
jgi:hypothetical protein